LNEKGKKVFILVGTNLRLENPILNIRLKKLSESNSVLVGYIGSKYNYNINLLHLGNNKNTLNSIIKGKHPFSTVIQNFLKTNNSNSKINNIFTNSVYVIFGNEFNQNNNNLNYIESLEQSQKSTLKFEFSTLQMFTGKINVLELGLFNNKNKINNNKQSLFYLINNETTTNIKENDFVIFQGHHNENLRTKFDIILPSLT
jgi:NADH-quinone oxidoreductase subunit G